MIKICLTKKNIRGRLVALFFESIDNLCHLLSIEVASCREDCFDEVLGASDWERGIDSIALSVDWRSLTTEGGVSLLEAR